ncbi:hypothetical protein [Halogeometricum salsisoli]|nr:hypothetical protein [Halogeometricum sp. S1BR25-6]
MGLIVENGVRMGGHSAGSSDWGGSVTDFVRAFLVSRSSVMNPTV